MTSLKESTANSAMEMVNQLYRDNVDGIIEAWQNTQDDEALTVSMSVKFAVNKKNTSVIDVDAGIAFVKEKVKQSEHSKIDQRQEGLPFESTSVILKDSEGDELARAENFTPEKFREATRAMKKKYRMNKKS